MTAALALEELLSPGWLKALEPVIGQQNPKDLQRFLSKTRDWTIPAREDTFAALRARDEIHQWNVVVLGQDPYPRAESAVGIAFNDGEIKKWTDKMNPSFTNIMKSVMAHEGKLKAGSDIAEFRKVAKATKLIDPPEWFNHTQREGVIWLNTALTFSSKDLNILKEHTDFWRPIITAIFENLIEAKKAQLKKDPKVKQGLVFIMWGGYAQKYRKIIEGLNAKTQPALPIAFVENNHPAATGDSLLQFHQNNSFTKTNEALKNFGLPEVRWFSDGSGGAAAAAAAPTSAASTSSSTTAAAGGATSEGEKEVKEKKGKKTKAEEAPATANKRAKKN